MVNYILIKKLSFREVICPHFNGDGLYSLGVKKYILKIILFLLYQLSNETK